MRIKADTPILSLVDQKVYILFFLLFLFPPISARGQVNIDRIESMPNLPQPYLMRDWQSVAIGYDSLVFDLELTGDHLPLVWINTNTVNYRGHDSFGLHTVVGTPYKTNAEAINVLPAVIGARLVGIDKSDQNGYNWVLGCEEFFNRRPEENVYLNGPVAQSGNDWWYDVMPNVFFYQLNYLYPGTGAFNYQFTSVADQWLRAVVAMGGSATPWQKASMNYRAWSLSTMTPYNRPGNDYKEPESAGSIAWLLYNAYVHTGETKYRLGAEWALEFLSDFTTNAAYELQLPYGIYTAARMNAELGTNYDVLKMLNWCFDPNGNEREWGTIIGTWGGYDVDGLVGKTLYATYGYAFAMNGFEMAGALVPMVRYDDRFARAIGKWVLNMANASRLFYSGFLPDSLQDGEDWAQQYDPNSYIAHEAMREFALGTGISPFATGDAYRGQWGATNFALYGASHVGILGGIIDTTDVLGILKLDLLKTDYYRKPAYPSFLFYNPHDADTTVTFDVGDETVDIYDAVTNSTLLYNVSGTVDDLPIPADGAILAVLVPTGGTDSYEYEKYLVDGIVVDYQYQVVTNYPPRIKAIAADSSVVLFGQRVDIYCTATDRDLNPLDYTWIVDLDTVARDTIIYEWTAPDSEGVFTVHCYVSDGIAAAVHDSITLTVVESINHAPEILGLEALRTVVLPGDSTEISCIASDPDADEIIYSWWADAGMITGSGSTIVWHAPAEIGYYYIHSQAGDNRGGVAVDSIGIVVADSGGSQIGTPVAYYPFNGNAADQSGLGNHGTVSGASLVADRFGNDAGAYYFNGTTDNIRIPSSASLNFQDAITVSFWMNPAELPGRESHPLSHGSWQNRWKISISPDKTIRWTVKSTTSVIDLDSEATVATGAWYHVVGIYDGTNFDLYLNGALDAHKTFSGSILTTDVDFMIGQNLPDISTYSFKGVLDDIRIYDYALTVDEIIQLYGEPGTDADRPILPTHFALSQNYPNPFNPQTTIEYQIKTAGNVKLEIFDLRGRSVDTIVNEYQQSGFYSIAWDAPNTSSGIYVYRLQTEDFTAVKKCVKLK